jgi:hypothetical protein
MRGFPSAHIQGGCCYEYNTYAHENILLNSFLSNGRSLTDPMSSQRRRCSGASLTGNGQYETIRVETEDGVSVITLARPKALNALNSQVCDLASFLEKSVTLYGVCGCPQNRPGYMTNVGESGLKGALDVTSTHTYTFYIPKRTLYTGLHTALKQYSVKRCLYPSSGSTLAYRAVSNAHELSCIICSVIACCKYTLGGASVFKGKYMAILMSTIKCFICL